MRSNRGFSVLELILALLLMSIVLLTVYSAYFQFIYAQDKASSTAQRFIDMTGGVAMITRDLTNIIHFDFSLSYPKQPAFSGKPERITFFSKQDTGIMAIEYDVVSLNQIYENTDDSIFKRFLEHAYEDVLDQNHFVVIRKIAPYQMYLQNKQWEKKRVLFPPFADSNAVHWRFKTTTEEGRIVWVREWAQEEGPDAVKLLVNLSASGVQTDNGEFIWAIKHEQNAKE